jgi:LysR family transcriptional regulator for metE and metH
MTPPSKTLRDVSLDPLRPIALELRHLRLVLAIEEEGGVTRAGERLHLTQSALSHQLREIEGRLGVELFLRVKKRLVLTAAGRQVVGAARRLLGEVVDLEEDLRGRAAGRRGLLRLTTECYTCYDWLPPLLKRFAELYPEVEVRIAVEATRRPLAALRGGDVDLALVTGPVAAPDVETRKLFDDELLLIAAADHPLARRRFVRPADLAAERLFLYSLPEESKFYQQFLARAGVAPREVVGVQLTEALLSMVRAGLGVSPIAGWAVDREMRRGELVGLRLGTRGLQRTWLAATRRGRREPAYLGEFAELVATHAAPRRFAERRAAARG